MSRTLLRSPGLYSTVALTVVAGVVVLALDPAVAVGARAAVWLVAGVALIARAGRRSEPTAAMALLGIANGVVAIAWALVAAGGDPTRVTGSALPLLAVGVAGIGVATLVATPSWRHRASLLDGVVLALAGATVMVAVVSNRPDSGLAVVTVETVAFVVLLGPSVMLASLVSRTLRPLPGALVPTLGMAALLHAGATTAAGALTGDAIGPVAEVTWVAAPVAGLVMALRPARSYRERSSDSVRRPTSVRLAVLVVLALVPAAVGVLVAPALVQTGLLLSLVAALVVAARIAASARTDVEEARAAADVRFDALVEHAAEVLALLDEEGRLFYVSRAVQETFHVPPAEVLGRSPTELAHPEDVQDVEDLLGRIGEQPGVPLHARLRLLDGHGSSRHVDVTIVDLRHVSGVNAISLTVRDVTERVTLEAELVRQARTDGLTGLVTRTVLIERVDHALTARRPAAALLFLDLDDFKLVNDGFGHAAGDEILAVLAGRLRLALRPHDTAGRMGGDEFAVLLEELSDDLVEDALQIANRVAVAASEPIVIDGEPLAVRLSIGVALPEPDMTTAELFAAADAAMYEAKRDKRGVVLYEPGMRASSRSRLRLMRDVRAAIDEGDLEVVYQPIVHAGTGMLQGAEALLRWSHPSLGSITPDIILDHADAAGLTDELTTRILEVISRDLRRWHQEVGERLELAINLSAQQLLHIEPEAVVLQLLGGPDVHGTLTIEITETSMLADLAAAARVLDVFRDAGCHVAIDDFGTGYASIGYLRRLPLDKLKIDREFIDGLSPATVDGSFAAVIQGLAAALDLTTVAEGVETESQLEAVRMLGCDLVQGFLFSPGLTIDELIAWSSGDREPVSDRA